MDRENMEIDRECVIVERKAAIQRWCNAPASEQVRVYREFIQPLNQDLNRLNKILGL